MANKNLDPTEAEATLLRFEPKDKRKAGRCYELSGEFVLRNPRSRLVHGEISINPENDFRIRHAWVEYKNGEVRRSWLRPANNGERVYDPVLQQEFAKAQYYAGFQATVSKRYTPLQLARLCIKHDSWDEWERPIGVGKLRLAKDGLRIFVPRFAAMIAKLTESVILAAK